MSPAASPARPGAVGLIANPSSGKDIRRLVAYGTVSDNLHKANMIRRMLMGLHAVGIRHVVYMEDPARLIQTAIDGLHVGDRDLIGEMDFEPTNTPVTGTDADSMAAAGAMRALGAACVMVLGGDGTCRAVAKGVGSVPLLPVSTGTNNVFPEALEGTIAGMAAGRYAMGTLDGASGLVRPSKRLEIYVNGEFRDIALIDAVVLDDVHRGSRAIWKTEQLVQVLLTCASPESIGISAIGGHLDHVTKGDPYGLALRCDREASRWVNAPVAPGLFQRVGIASCERMALDSAVDVARSPSVLALDGEREIELVRRDRAEIRLSANGPGVLDISRIMRAGLDLPLPTPAPG